MVNKIIRAPRGTKRKIKKSDRESADNIIIQGNKQFEDRSGLITSEISPKRLERIYRNAESSGDLGSLYEFYKKIEKYDAKLQGLVEKRRTAITRFDWELEISKHAKKEGNNITETLEFVDKVLSRNSFDFDGLRESAMDGKLYGMKNIVKIPERSGDMLAFKAWKEIPVQSYRQNVFTLGAKKDVPYIKLRNLDKIFLDDVSTFEFATFFGKNRTGNYDIDGLMRPVGKWFIVKNLITRFWVDYDRVHGSPTTVLKVRRSLYKQHKNFFDNFISSVTRNKFGVLFQGSDYEIHSDSRSGSQEVFKEFLRYADNEMAIALWGQNTATSDDEGSFAKSTELRKDEIDIVIDDGKWMDRHINKYFVNPLIRANFTDINPDWINFRTKTPKTRDWSNVKEKYELAMRSNISVDREQFENEVGITVKPEKDEDGDESKWINLSMSKQETNNHNEEIDDLDSEKRKDQRKDGGSVAE